MNSPVVIHRAAWVLPISEPIIRDGAVAVRDGKILGRGPYDQLKLRFSGAEVLHHRACVLMPPLINAHVHLELSHLAFLGREQTPTSFTSWVERLIGERGRHPFSEEEILEKGREVLRKFYEQGVSGLADTGNLLVSGSIGADFPGRYLFFHEHLGFSPQAAERELQAAQGEGAEEMCTPHAPYSCNSLLIKGLKERAQRNNSLISIHVAETEAENRFIRHGDGPFRDFLEKLGAMDPSFRAEAIDNCGAMRYLHQLGILDQGTICVHCVQVNDMEIQSIAESGAKVCLCPGSNRFLGVGRAPVARFLAAGILPALGTDSLASNPELSLWREMRILREDNPEVQARDILAMATLGGARALGMDDVYGCLSEGISAEMLAVPVGDQCATGGEVMELLISAHPDIMPIRV